MPPKNHLFKTIKCLMAKTSHNLVVGSGLQHKRFDECLMTKTCLSTKTSTEQS